MTTLDHRRVSKPHQVESTVVKISLYRLCACCSRTVPGDSCVPSWQGLDFVHERREGHASKSVAAAVSAGIRLSAPLYLTQQRENLKKNLSNPKLGQGEVFHVRFGQILQKPYF